MEKLELDLPRYILTASHCVMIIKKRDCYDRTPEYFFFNQSSDLQAFQLRNPIRDILVLGGVYEDDAGFGGNAAQQGVGTHQEQRVESVVSHPAFCVVVEGAPSISNGKVLVQQSKDFCIRLSENSSLSFPYPAAAEYDIGLAKMRGSFEQTKWAGKPVGRVFGLRCASPKFQERLQGAAIMVPGMGGCQEDKPTGAHTHRERK